MVQTILIMEVPLAVHTKSLCNVAAPLAQVKTTHRRRLEQPVKQAKLQRSRTRLIHRWHLAFSMTLCLIQIVCTLDNRLKLKTKTKSTLWGKELKVKVVCALSDLSNEAMVPNMIAAVLSVSAFSLCHLAYLAIKSKDVACLCRGLLVASISRRNHLRWLINCSLSRVT